jgi:hypothetical protein
MILISQLFHHTAKDILMNWSKAGLSSKASLASDLGITMLYVLGA